MAIVGRMIRAKMRDDARETRERVAARMDYRMIATQVNREREAKFPVLTSENMSEAIAWQEARIKTLTN